MTAAVSGRAVAYHAAGHAVSAVVLRMRLGRVTVERRATSGDLPHVSLPLSLLGRLADPTARPSHRLLERHLISLLAGPEAEARAAGAYDHSEAAGDHLAAADFAMRTTPHYQEWLDAAQARTAALVEREWQAIEAVAEALGASGALSAAEVRDVVQRTRSGDR